MCIQLVTLHVTPLELLLMAILLAPPASGTTESDVGPLTELNEVTPK